MGHWHAEHSISFISSYELMNEIGGFVCVDTGVVTDNTSAMVKKQITAVDLARGLNSLRKAIETLASTTEKLAMTTQEEFLRLNRRIDLLGDNNELMRQDVHDIKVSLGPLSSTIGYHERTLREYGTRITRLERKAGIAR